MRRGWVIGWDLLPAFGAAFLAALFLDPLIFKNITAELITFFGIQSAIILPAMMFTAGILRPEGLTLSDVDRYHSALRQQMIFWVVLLALDFIAVLLLIVGQSIEWVFLIEMPFSDNEVDIAKLIAVALSFFGVLAILRAIPFVKGVISLLELNAAMARKAVEIRMRAELKAQKKSGSLGQIKLPSGYGDVVASEDDG